MSRPRVVDGVDARGRPRTRWADAPELEAPRYGHMEPAYPPGSVERRTATPDELARLGAKPASPIAPVRVAQPALSNAERMAQSRQNGARRHVEVMAARKAQEEPPMPDAEVRTPPDGEEWSVFADIESAARAAAVARRDLDAAIVARQVASDAFDAAIAELEAIWSRLRAEASTNGRTSMPENMHPEPALEHLDNFRSVAPSQPAKRHKSSSTEDQEKTDRARRVMDAIERHGGDRRAAATELGMKLNAVSMVAKHAASRVSA